MQKTAIAKYRRECSFVPRSVILCSCAYDAFVGVLLWVCRRCRSVFQFVLSYFSGQAGVVVEDKSATPNSGDVHGMGVLVRTYGT